MKRFKPVRNRSNKKLTRRPTAKVEGTKTRMATSATATSRSGESPNACDNAESIIPDSIIGRNRESVGGNSKQI